MMAGSMMSGDEILPILMMLPYIFFNTSVYTKIPWIMDGRQALF